MDRRCYNPRRALGVLFSSMGVAAALTVAPSYAFATDADIDALKGNEAVSDSVLVPSEGAISQSEIKIENSVLPANSIANSEATPDTPAGDSGDIDSTTTDSGFVDSDKTDDAEKSDSVSGDDGKDSSSVKSDTEASDGEENGDSVSSKSEGVNSANDSGTSDDGEEDNKPVIPVAEDETKKTSDSDASAQASGSSSSAVANQPKTNQNNAAATTNNGSGSQSGAGQTKSDQIVADGVYLIESAKNGWLVLDAASGKTSNGTNVQAYTSNMSAAQKWQISYDSKSGFYKIGLSGTNKLLDISGGKSAYGTNVQLYQENGTDAQLWKIVQQNGAYLFISKLRSDLVLDLQGGGTTAGTNVQVYRRNNTAAQLFYLINTKVNVAAGETLSSGDGSYIVASSKDKNAVVSVKGNSKDSFANVEVSKINTNESQRLYFESDGSGFYIIKVASTGKVVEAADGNLINGTNVRQNTLNNSSAQKWALRKQSDGSFTFVNKANGFVLDISGGVASAGRNIQTYRSNNTAAQKFYLTKLSNAASGASYLVDNGVYLIESAKNLPQVFDSASGGTGDRNNVQIYASNMTSAQKWKITRVGTSDYYTIGLNGTNKVLDVASGKWIPTSNVQIYHSNGTAAQMWKFVKNSNGTLSIVSKLRNDLVLDLASGSTANCSNVQVYNSNGTAAQQFKLINTNVKVSAGDTSVKDGAYTILAGSASSKYVVDVAGGSIDAGANVALYSSNSTQAQRYYLKKDSSGFYSIYNIGSGKVLEVKDGNLVPSANVRQWTYNGSNCQKWAIQKNFDGTYAFVNKATGLALDFAAGKLSNNTNIQQWTRYSGASQKFGLKSTSILTDGIYKISSMYNANQVLDVAGGAGKNNLSGAKVQTYHSNDTLAQRYQVKYDSNTGTYRIRTAASGGWITQSGSSIIQSGKSTTAVSSSNAWSVVWNGNYFSLKNVGSGQMLTLGTSSNKSSANDRVVLRAANQDYASDQHFLFRVANLLTNGLYEIHYGANTNKNLDIASGSNSSGANVQTYADNNSGAQKFYVTATGSGYVIKNFKSGKVVAVSGNSKADGANVIQANSGASSQVWNAQIGDGGSIIFVNANSGLALSCVSSGNVVQSKNNGSSSQSWKLETTIGTGWYQSGGSWTYCYANGNTATFTAAAYSAWQKIKSWSSETSYLICIDNSQLRTVIFKGSANNWAPVLDCLCSVGKAPANQAELNEGYGKTVRGVYKIVNKGYVMGNDPDYFYWSEFWQPRPGEEGQRFHSRPYWRNASGTPGSLYDNGNFGKAQTHGCVRLNLSDVKFIYDNCPLGTKVYSY